MDVKCYPYEFIDDVMSDGSLSKHERRRYYKYIALPYINDPEFRRKYHGKYTLFVGGRLVGIVATQGDAINFPQEGTKIAYYIGEDQPSQNQF
jgi:hypothetical protein